MATPPSSNADEPEPQDLYDELDHDPNMIGPLQFDVIQNLVNDHEMVQRPDGGYFHAMEEIMALSDLQSHHADDLSLPENSYSDVPGLLNDYRLRELEVFFTTPSAEHPWPFPPDHWLHEFTPQYLLARPG